MNILKQNIFWRYEHQEDGFDFSLSPLSNLIIVLSLLASGLFSAALVLFAVVFLLGFIWMTAVCVKSYFLGEAVYITSPLGEDIGYLKKGVGFVWEEEV